MVDPSIRYLCAADVTRCLPGISTQLELARRALRAVARGEAEMPPKVGVHPRPGALLHAMPAWLRTDDLVGVKWVSAYPGNRALGLEAVGGTIVLNDAATGIVTWVMDASVITAVRTAAVSGVAIARYAPDDARHVALIGAGVQGASHVRMLADVLPGAELLIHDRHHERADRLAEDARHLGLRARVVDAARAAAAGARIVITAGALDRSRQAMGRKWLDRSVLVVAVDFATHASAELAHDAHFVVDDREQFLAYRSAGHFDGFPEPDATLGDESEDARSGSGELTVVTHLGIGLADVVFADAVARVASERDLGIRLPR